MNKLATIINSMDYRDLKSLQRDLYEGNIGNLIKKNIDKTDSISKRICPTCGTTLKKPPYSLEFGREDFKKRAGFCGLDCLSFFVTNLNKEKTIVPISGYLENKVEEIAK